MDHIILQTTDTTTKQTGNLGKGHEPVTRAERKLYQ